MKQQTISPQQLKALPRKVRRELERQAKQEGRIMPDIKETVKVFTIADKILWQQSLAILEANNIQMKDFFNICLERLIAAEKEARTTKL